MNGRFLKIYLISALLAPSSFATVGAAVGAAVQTRNPWIIGGTEVKEGSPIAKRIVAIDSGDSACTGTLIEDDVVLTVGHCTSRSARSMRVYLGPDVERPHASREVLDFQDHLLYKPDAYKVGPHDLSILILNEKFPPGEFTPAKLLPPDYRMQIGDELTVAGYGTNLSLYEDQGVGRLRELKLRLFDLVRGDEFLDESILEQNANQGVCSGDSGGPVFVPLGEELFLAGVIKAVSSEGCHQNSIFTRIAYDPNWIPDTIQLLRARIAKKAEEAAIKKACKDSGRKWKKGACVGASRI